MLLPPRLPFKLKQAEGRNTRNVKARARTRFTAGEAERSPRALLGRVLTSCPALSLTTQKTKNILLAEEYHLLPPKEPTCARRSRLVACTCLSETLFPLPAVVNIEAPPSTYPPKKFCDITGQVARYTDPKTKLQYADAAAFAAVRRLSPDAVQARLALRRAAVVLK